MSLTQLNIGGWNGGSSNISHDVTNANTLIAYKYTYKSAYASSTEGKLSITIYGIDTAGAKTNIFSKSRTWSNASESGTIECNQIIDISNYVTIQIYVSTTGNKCTEFYYGYI